MTGSPEQVIARLAGAQRTIVGHDQLEAAGIQRHAISYRVKSGSLHVVFRGVYSVVSGPLPPLALELAALIACAEKSFISHRSAAYVWGLLEAPPARVEVSVVGRACRSREGLRVHRLEAIDRREIQRHEGLWISTPARALLEIAATSSFDELADAVTAGVGRRLVTPREVESVRKRNPGRRGAARLAAVVGDESAATITRSRAERAFWKLLRDARLPVPEVNQRLGPYVPDFMWREQRLIVEVDSYQFHAGPRGWGNDHDKDLFYREAGFDVLRPTRNQVVYQPARVLVSLVRGLWRRRSD
jgi:very-short-patch-repair endonuclease